MNDDRNQGKQLAWAVLSKAKGSQLSQVIKVTNHIEADETVAAQPDTLYKSGPFYIGWNFEITRYLSKVSIFTKWNFQ